MIKMKIKQVWKKQKINAKLFKIDIQTTNRSLIQKDEKLYNDSVSVYNRTDYKIPQECVLSIRFIRSNNED